MGFILVIFYSLGQAGGYSQQKQSYPQAKASAFFNHARIATYCYI